MAGAAGLQSPQSARMVRRAQGVLSEKERSQEREAVELTRRLFLLPAALRPDGSGAAGELATKSGDSGALGNRPNDDHPAPIVLSLESTEVGCRWLLDRWKPRGSKPCSKITTRPTSWRPATFRASTPLT